MKLLLLLLCLVTVTAFSQPKSQTPVDALPEATHLVHHRVVYLADALLLSQHQARQVEKLLQLLAQNTPDEVGSASKLSAQQKVVLRTLSPRQYQGLLQLEELPGIGSPANRWLVAANR